MTGMKRDWMPDASQALAELSHRQSSDRTDVYFSADVETDGPIPGPYSMLSFALVYAGRFDGGEYEPPQGFSTSFYRELQPISDAFEQEALDVNGLDRTRLIREGLAPEAAMTEASRWVQEVAGDATPVLVAYPLSFDWAWLYWYFVRFSTPGSPFKYSNCFDLKTAFAVKTRTPIARAGRRRMKQFVSPSREHTHNALEDATEQAEMFVKLFDWNARDADSPHRPKTRGRK
jgi:hypothetical protein